ncbi:MULTISPECIES: transporter substrate-binding domain-containing protein [Cupriavidus]
MVFSSHAAARMLGALVLLGASAGAAADQLADVRARGTLTCAVLGNFEPYGFAGADRRIVGYDVDTCQAIAGRLGVKAAIKPVTNEARIPELQAGRVDLLVAGLAYSRERAAQIAYTDAYYVILDKLVVRTDKGFQTRDQLDGKRVSYAKGGIEEVFTRQVLPRATLVGFEDYPAAFMALAQGKADAFVVSEPVSVRLINKLGPGASKFAFIEPPVGEEAWGIGVRKTEPAMLAAVNDALRALERAGEFQQIFDRWLGSDSPYKLKRSFKVGPMPE